jgi:lipopolysaccharide/colanic/teichoic acid biosynthesis glycosyltransferase
LWGCALVTAVLDRRRLDQAGSTGPIFFRQERVGTGFRPLNILKFRTVDDDVEKRGGLITAGNDPRVTGAGRFLRKTSLAVKTLSVTD